MVNQRIRYEKIIHPLALERINNKQCPVCEKPRTKWSRHRRNHLEWNCCSEDCTSKFHKEFCTYNDWNQIRKEAFERDGHVCKECKTRKPIEQLIADHIIPIALGGEEFNLSNIQTLCKNCNKPKTAQDQKDIAKLRKKEKVLKHHKPLMSYMVKDFLKFKYDKQHNKIMIINKKDETIGEIIYHKPWKKWAQTYYAQTLFDDKCQLQILKKLVKLNKIRKK